MTPQRRQVVEDGESYPPRSTTVWSLLVVGMLVGLCAAMLLPVLSKVREKANRSGCKGNQKQLLLSAIMYRDSQGRNIEFPPFDGSAFLTHLYMTGVNTEADQFICASSGDDNSALLFTTGPRTRDLTSYAGRLNATQSRYPGLYTARGATETAMTSDDSEGLVRFNHDDCCVVGFADGHVEEIPLDDSRMAGIHHVGQPGLLHPLGN